MQVRAGGKTRLAEEADQLDFLCPICFFDFTTP
jgi:hypothetical protein